MLEIRRCRGDEVQELMQFLDMHWQSGHVLATSQALMDWQHKAADGNYNYLIAKTNGQILGVLGYISSSSFDPKLGDQNVIWLALWKVRDDSGIPGLGLRLLNALSRVEKHAAIAVNGINISHPPMYRALGFQVEELSHYFLVNPQKPQTLIRSPSDWKACPPVGTDTTFTEVDSTALDELETQSALDDVHPAKSPAYFRTRFLEHPFYTYKVYCLRSSNGRLGLLALRVAVHEGRRVLRIVDFAGDNKLLGSCGVRLAQIMRDEDAEYADFWSLGIAHEVLSSSGFERVDHQGSIVVPNYFEPYLSRNGRILCAFKCHAAARFQVFRADGDQDRPNAIDTRP
jgi:hypothetical protein